MKLAAQLPGTLNQRVRIIIPRLHDVVPFELGMRLRGDQLHCQIKRNVVPPRRGCMAFGQQRLHALSLKLHVVHAIVKEIHRHRRSADFAAVQPYQGSGRFGGNGDCPPDTSRQQQGSGQKNDGQKHESRTRHRGHCNAMRFCRHGFSKSGGQTTSSNSLAATLLLVMAKKKTAQVVSLDASMRIVVLYGKEQFLIEEFTRRFAQSLDEHFGGIERFTFDGANATAADVLDELRSYGLMQKHKLVIVDNADQFLQGRRKADDDDNGGSDASGSSTGTRRLLEKYAEHPVDDATLLMRAETWRAGNLDKLIAKVGGVYECSPLDEGKATIWCMKRCEKRHDAKLEHAAAELLVARLGPELQRLDVEMSKLAAMVGSGGTITREMVAGAVALSREEKAWEIQAAIATGNASIMLRKLRELLEISRQDVVPITWATCDLLRKIHASAQLLGRGVPPAGVRSQVKLWGSAADHIIRIASRTSPEKLAQLLQMAITTDAHNKSGVGEPQRNLEALLVRIADTIGQAA